MQSSAAVISKQPLAESSISNPATGLTASSATRLTLPLPPSVNQLYSSTFGGRRVKSKRYRDWLLLAGLDLDLQRIQPIDGDIMLNIRCRRPDRRKRDIST